MKSGRFQLFLNFGEPLRDSDGDGRLDLSIANAFQEPGLAGIPLADITLNLRLDGGGPPFTGLHNLNRFSTVDRERGIATFVVPYADLLDAMAPAERAAMDQGDGTGRLFLWAVSHLYGDQDRIPDTNDGADPTIRSEVREFRFPLKDLRLTPRLTFGRVLLTSRLDGPLTLANHGVTPISIEGVEIPNPALSLSLTPPFRVPGGGRSQLTLRYAPMEHEALSGNIAFQSDDPANSTVEMHPMGQGVAPIIRVSPASLDFGSTPVGIASSPDPGLSVTIGNDGDTTLKIVWDIVDPAAQFSLGYNSQYYPPPDNRNLSLGPGETKGILLRFYPNRVGTAQAVFRMTTNDPFHPQVDVALTGTGTPPEPRISVDYTFQGYERITGVPMGSAGSVSFRVGNVGSAPLQVLSVTSDRPDFNGAVNPATIPAGSIGTLTVTYRPTTWGDFGAHLTVTSDDPTRPAVTGYVGGSAFEPPPRARVSQTALNFGRVEPDTPVTLTFEISDEGSPSVAGRLRLSGISPPTPAACMFQTDLTLPTTLEPGTARTVHVTLTPDANKSSCDSFTFNTNDPTLPAVTITFQAYILWPAITYTPSTLSFPSTGVGYSSSQRIEIDNRGEGPLRISQAVFDRAEFALGGPLPDPIPPGGAIYLTVVFTPATAGTLSSHMKLITNDPFRKEVIIPLSGTGVPAGAAKTTIGLSGD